MKPGTDAERAAYYHQQSSDCAEAAAATTTAEVRQAYIELAQGWLCLVPKAKQDPDRGRYPISEDAGGGEAAADNRAL